MDIFEIILLNMILVMFPLLCYLFFIAYNKSISGKQNQLSFTIALVTSLYLTMKFGQSPIGTMSLLSVQIPLFLAYIKKRDRTALMLSLLIMLYYHYYFHFSIIVLGLQMLIYYLLYWLMKRNYNTENNIFLTMIIMIASCFYLLCHYLLISTDIVLLGKLLFVIVFFFIIANFVYLMFEKGEEILKYHMTIKTLEQEKQIHQSLFRITHEIKNPIAVCKGYLDMFDVNNPEHTKKYVPIIKEEIERTLLLLQDFLNMSKIQITTEPLDINLLLDDVITSFKPILLEKKVQLDCLLGDDEIYVLGDYGRLSQVFVNVIKNSIEAFKEDKNCRLKIYTQSKEKEFHICIEDNGEGISNEDLEKISEPFFTTKKKGTGLGISLSCEIIKAHRGKITYESELHEGTKVTIILPLKEQKRILA